MYRSLRVWELKIEQKRDAARDRWLSPGNADDQAIIAAITTSGHGFLAALRAAGLVTTPLSDRDLRGLRIVQPPQGQAVISTASDALDDVDLTYANIQGVTFRGAFFASNIVHATVANVTFRECTFFTARIAYSELFNVTFDRCDFVRCNFLNCDLIATQVRSCFWNESTVEDCRCDPTSDFDPPASRMQRTATVQLTATPHDDIGLAGPHLAAFYTYLSEGFRVGSAFRRARHFEYLANQTIRRTRPRIREAAIDWVIEVSTGYGLRPWRLAFVLGALVVISGAYFSWRLGSGNGWMLGAGAVFTFGAFADVLKDHPWFDVVAYVASSVIGLAVMALLVATVVTTALRDRS